MRDEHQLSVGRVIARLRQEQGWSQRQLAKWVGLDQSAVSRIEAGRRRVSAKELHRFADTFRVSADALLLGVPDDETPEPAALPAPATPYPTSSPALSAFSDAFESVDDLESRLLPTSEPDALFSAYDVSFKGGLSYEIDEKLAFGAALGWYIEKIDIYRGSAFNVDLGGLYRLTPQVDLGASVTNLGSSLSLATSGKEGSEDIDLPVTYRFGGSYRQDKYTGELDAVIVDDEFHVNAGGEAALHELFSVRAGYMIGYDTKNFTAGASFKRRNVAIEYAFVPYTDDLGTSHLFNLTFTL